MTSTAPPIEQPYYGAPIAAAFARFFRKYGVFTGRASRSEFWWWALIWVVVIAVLQVIESATGGVHTASVHTAQSSSVNVNDGGPIGVILGLIALGTLIPFLAVAARRFHDANISAWLLLLLIIPILGVIVILILALQPTRPAGQRFDRYPGGSSGYPPYPPNGAGQPGPGYQPTPPGYQPGPPAA